MKWNEASPPPSKWIHGTAQHSEAQRSLLDGWTDKATLYKSLLSHSIAQTHCCRTYTHTHTHAAVAAVVQRSTYEKFQPSDGRMRQKSICCPLPHLPVATSNSAHSLTHSLTHSFRRSVGCWAPKNTFFGRAFFSFFDRSFVPYRVYLVSLFLLLLLLSRSWLLLLHYVCIITVQTYLRTYVRARTHLCTATAANWA